MFVIVLKGLLLISLIFMLYVNYTANTKPLGGNTTGEMSDKYPTMFTPSGFTFSIWGIIYILVLLSAGKLLLSNDIDILVTSLFILSCILNASWLYAWHHDKIMISTIVMVLLLATLLILMSLQQPLDIGYYTFSIYSGWISVATILNFSILIVKYKIPFFMKREKLFFTIMLIISMFIGIAMSLFLDNYLYSLVFIWAYYGIYNKHKQNKRAY